MFARRRKHKIQAWSEVDPSLSGFAKLRENLRSSNRLWVACFLAVIVLGVYGTIVTSRSDTSREINIAVPSHRNTGVYDDEKHRKLIRDFHRQIRMRGVNVEARFINSGELRITVPSDTSNDDISFLSKAAATAVLLRFRNSAIVYVYTRDNSVPPVEKLKATTNWVKTKNGFEVKFQGIDSTDPDEIDASSFGEYPKPTESLPE
jgi:hypothetical protein